MPRNKKWVLGVTIGLSAVAVAVVGLLVSVILLTSGQQEDASGDAPSASNEGSLSASEAAGGDYARLSLRAAALSGEGAFAADPEGMCRSQAEEVAKAVGTEDLSPDEVDVDAFVIGCVDVLRSEATFFDNSRLLVANLGGSSDAELRDMGLQICDWTDAGSRPEDLVAESSPDERDRNLKFIRMAISEYCP